MRCTREDGKLSVGVLSCHPLPTMLDGMKSVPEMALACRPQPPTVAKLRCIFLP
jgi:hypothetical protein